MGFKKTSLDLKLSQYIIYYAFLSWTLKTRKISLNESIIFERVEIIVANGEKAHYEYLLHLPQYFHKKSAVDASESIYTLESV